MEQDLFRLFATAAVALLKEGRVTPLQLVAAAEARWKATDGAVNAMPITCWETARTDAQQLMQQGYPADPPRGYLYGLPIAIKDAMAVKGLPFTVGSRVFKHRVADEDDPLVEVLRRKGGIIVGKTNVPEMCAGSHTYNQVYGITRNPWDTSRSAGGSSGGTAAALALGQVWGGTGSDLGGSMRNPAAWCGVVGMRVSPGTIPGAPLKVTPESLGIAAWSAGHPVTGCLLSVNGPLARNVPDLAVLLDAMAEQHTDDPWSLPPPSLSFTSAISPGALPSPTRIAFSLDLGGLTRVDPGLAAAASAAAAWWRGLGAEVVEGECLDLRDMPRVFNILRAVGFKELEHLLSPEYRDQIKPELVWQIQQGLEVTEEEVTWAISSQRQAVASAQQFFKKFDLLMTPTVMMEPFPVTWSWPHEYAGVSFPNYLEWMRTCSALSALHVPAISVPCGITHSGLPIGLQIIGGCGQDQAVLAAAAAFERAHHYHTLVPREVKEAAS